MRNYIYLRTFGLTLSLAACTAAPLDGEAEQSTDVSQGGLRNGQQNYEGYRFLEDGSVVFYNQAPIAKEAALAIFNKYYGCEVNEDAVTGKVCGAESASCVVAHMPGADIWTKPTSNMVARCSPTKSTNWGWREEMRKRLGDPRDWDPTDASNKAWSGNALHPFVAFNRNQQIWFSTFERGQLYGVEDWGRGGFLVYEVANIDTASATLPHVNWFSWYAKQLRPAGTNSFLGVPLSGHESGLSRCEGGTADGHCMFFGRFNPPGAEGGPECMFLVRTLWKGGESVFHVSPVAPWDGPNCAVPAQMQDLPNKRL